MVMLTSTYEGGLRCRATHGPSGTTLITDAPVDNHGKGESFSPTDLVATALGACMMTIMGIVAERHGLDLTGMKAETVKEMSKDSPRRIAGLRTRLTVPLPADHPQRQLLEQKVLVYSVPNFSSWILKLNQLLQNKLRSIRMYLK